ncbi:COX15/CtaA family protein [Mobilicoccus caccae]|uniref:Protein required for cytochrome oxidase assembly n=1 Tax=Mobilicoccus caccae TaxID=1859295 RepID=A0ABQ6IS34_9MICO|nr:COX15/CtaA family protein [Mobilicoccus caccae]GMA39498.1 protein required for cytochrome oxidase assembly [Mobilicoccus caccae]
MSTSVPNVDLHPRHADPVERPIRWIFLANLICQVGIIVTGGLVRLTGSGLGCPTWPQCAPGSYTPTVEQAEGFHKYIEFGNRLLTFVLLVAALAVVWAVWKRLTHRRSLRLPALLVLGGVVFQAILGGITVLTELHPVTVAAHFLVSAALVAVSAYLYLRLDETEDAPQPLVPPIVRTLGWVTVVVTAVVLTLGTVVTGSGPHSGDADTPARFDLDPAAMSWLHADAVILFVGLVVALWLACHLSAVSRPTVRAGRAWRDLLVLLVIQAIVGYAQYALGLPEWLVLLHMFFAALTVVLLTRAIMTMRARGALTEDDLAGTSQADVTTN